MAKRILTAVIWLPIAALGFAFAPVWAIALAISALSVRILAGFTVFSGWNAAPGESQI